MKDLVEKIEKQIDTDRNVITVLPRKGIKSIKTLIATTEEMVDKYEQLNKKILDEIKKRYNELTDVKANDEIPKLESEILKFDVAIKKTDTRSSFEKMGLDKIVYNVNGYYKSNLERLNKELVNCVKQFEAVGIKLTAKDFDISEYAQKYMAVLLKEAYNGEINSETIKEAFEKEYCKCSDLVSHLYVCIRHIYDKYEREIDKTYEHIMEGILKKINSTLEQVEDTKIALIKRKRKLEDIDNKVILEKFYNGVFNVNDFKEANYKSIYYDLISEDVSQLSEKQKAEMDEYVGKLNDNLNEYAKYVEYKFLVDGVLDIRNTELQSTQNAKSKKREYDSLKEEIKKITANIFKINAKLEKSKNSLFGAKFAKDKKNSAKILERDNLILELKKLYKKLDEEILKQKIMKNIDETSSILDVLKLASHYYGFMEKEIIKKYPEMTDQEVAAMAKEIRDFITFSNFTVINYIKISDKKELSVIIKDKYKLFGMELSRENFEEGNVEDLIRKTKTINDYNNLAKSKFSIEDIEFILNVRNILKQ